MPSNSILSDEPNNTDYMVDSGTIAYVVNSIELSMSFSEISSSLSGTAYNSCHSPINSGANILSDTNTKYCSNLFNNTTSHKPLFNGNYKRKPGLAKNQINVTLLNIKRMNGEITELNVFQQKLQIYQTSLAGI
uniref:Uncharacterized protein n=1 Tax=Rhabditophanes sp. KR3021 TaxID=114890 RepID=A0AC35UGV1_9BILA